MAYTKTEWQNEASGDTPINADNLTNMENGIYNNDTNITDIQSKLFYKAGDTQRYGLIFAGGCLTGGGQSIYFSIPLPKTQYGLKASITGGTIYARGTNGYLLNGANIMNARNIIVTTYTNFLTIELQYPTFSSATNNTPVSIHLSGLQIAFSEA